jgi:polar amino acid transport system substrate-binding protein
MNKTAINLLYYLSFILTLIPYYSAASDLIILRGDEDYPPDEMHINGVLTGFNIELIQNVASSISLSVKFESYPWKRAIKVFKDGEADAITYFSKNSDREQYALFLKGNILKESHYHFIANSQRKDKISYQGELKDLLQYSIGMQRGYAYNKELNQAQFKSKSVLNSVYQMTSLIKANRIDLAVLTSGEYEAQKNTEIFNNIEMLSPAIFSNVSYLAFSKTKNTNSNAEKFAKAMIIFKASKAYQALKNKYK